ATFKADATAGVSRRMIVRALKRPAGVGRHGRKTSILTGEPKAHAGFVCSGSAAEARKRLGSLTGGGAGQTASAGSQPTTDTSDAGGLLGGLGGLLNKLEQGGLGDQTKSWVGTGQNKPVSPGQLGQALGPNIIKTLSQMTGVSEDQLTKQLSQGIP